MTVISTMTAWAVRQVITAARLQLIQDNIEALDAALGGLMPVVDDELASPASSFSVTGITADALHLLWVLKAKSTRSDAQSDTLAFRINGDTGNNYHWKAFYSHGGASTVSVDGNEQAAYINLGELTCSHSLVNADSFGNYFGLIFNYVNADHFKMLMAVQLGMIEHTQPAATYLDASLGLRMGEWQQGTTEAVDQIDIFPVTGPNFAAGSRLTIYKMGSLS